MTSPHVDRRLAAILAADVVGYSRMMGTDEVGTLEALKAIRREFVDPAIQGHRGRIVKTTGDGLLVEFASAIDAVNCAAAVQEQMAAAAGGARGIVFRIGINIGDIIIDGDDIFGDGVNVAARLEAAADPLGIAISEDVWRQVAGKVSPKFEDGGELQLKNIARPVRVFRVRFGDAQTAPPVKAAPQQRERPALAVLPFQNFSGDPEQEFFCDGLVEDIITTLSKLSDLKVIARNSSFAYKGRTVDIRDAARHLGVRYVLEGSVRRSGQRVRITAQLIDASDATHLWAERYDRSVEDIFAIQDEITLALATELQVRLTEGEQARLRYTTTHNIEAWNCWVQGLTHYRKVPTKEHYTAARQWWEKALVLDPRSAPLHAMLAFVHCLDVRFAWWDPREQAFATSRRYAGQALAIDPDNADATLTLGCLHAFDGEFDAAIDLVRKAVQLAPGAAEIANVASFTLGNAGCAAEALELAQRSIALDPNYPPLYLGALGNAWRYLGRLDETIETFEAFNARVPGFGLVDVVIAQVGKNDLDKARDAARRLLAARPNFTISTWHATQVRRDKTLLAADIAALRTAGLPE